MPKFAGLAATGAFVLMSVMLGRPAMAASFDCATAKSPREKLICGDPNLSALDGTLGQLYDDKRALLSPAGANLLRQSQRSWLRFTDMVCMTGKSTARYDTPAACLSAKYDERLSELKAVGQMIGPYRFNRIDMYAGRPIKEEDNTGSLPGFSMTHVAYPQIDNPATQAAVEWNRLVAGHISTDVEDDEDTELDFEIGSATDRLISLQWDDYYYGHGAAHGVGGSNVWNEIMTPKLRVATDVDFFGKGDAWIKPLQKLFFDALKAKGWALPESGSGDVAAGVKGDIEKHVTMPEHWLVTRDGLQTSFDAYEGGCYACNPGRPTATWAKLKPILSKDAVAP